MKHEALVNAITMLDDELIEEAREPFRRRIAAPVFGFCAAAVCAAAVGVFLLVPRSGGADILVMGQELSDKPIAICSDDGGDSAAVGIRAFAMLPTDISVEIVSSGKTVVNVSGGELYIVGETENLPAECPLELSGDASLVWSVPLWDAGEEYELTAQTGIDSRILLVSFDEEMQEWTVKENTQP